MIVALKIIIGILLVFTAIGLLCAVGIARSRDSGIGRRRPPAADPFFHPFGEMPGFTQEQLARFPLRQGYGGQVAPHHTNPGVTATPPVAGSGASSFPSGDAAARVSLATRSGGEIRQAWRRSHRHAR